jgi:type I restriction enzyme R subunit
VSNFAFLRAEWGQSLYSEARTAERNALIDPRASCFYARRSLELAVQWLYQADRALTFPRGTNPTLSNMLKTQTFRNTVEPKLRTKMDLIRRLGNDAVHSSAEIRPETAQRVVTELFHVLLWLALRYTRDQPNLPHSALVFDATLLPRIAPAEQQRQTRAELRALEARFADQDARLAESERQNAAYQAQIAELRDEIAFAKAANAGRTDEHDYDETETRREYIDLLLREAGWRLDQPHDHEYPVTGMPTGSGSGSVDYVLWGDDGLPLGLVEAKRTGRRAADGKHQAKLYADCLETQFARRPVIFYSNGFDTWIWDDLTGPPRQVPGFYTKDELAWLVSRRTGRRSLAYQPIKHSIVERDYQLRAIRRVGEAFEAGRRREALLVMATGAGKTRTVVALVEQMMQASWIRRVLFLADRKALVRQARKAFKTHLAEVPAVNLVEERQGDGRIYVSTYPTMMGLIDEKVSGARRFGPGFFDLVVIDEAHRSIFQKYGAILDYFDALLLGLTATPREEVDRNTYRRFNLDNGVPTEAYPLEDAVYDGFLVPYRPVTLPLRFPNLGVRYEDLTQEEKDEWDSKEWSDDGDVPDEVLPGEINRWLLNDDTIDKVLETLMQRGHKVDGGDRLGKTIIFARSRVHAERIAKRFDVNYPEYRGQFAQVIAHEVSYAETLIEDFGTPHKLPQIAISVDMLDTGIDVPEVANLVFFKTVRSTSKFWQMIGRGTRLRKDLYGPGRDKQDFFIFDVCRNFEYFDQNPASSEGSLVEPLLQRIFRARLNLLRALDERQPETPEGSSDVTSSLGALRVDVAFQLQDVTARMNHDNFIVGPHRRWVEKYSGPIHWRRMSPESYAEIETHLAPLPENVTSEDERIRRFDLRMLHLQLASLGVEAGFTRQRAEVQEIVSLLLDHPEIPVIREQEPFLRKVAEDDWWGEVTPQMLELLRLRVRRLVVLIERAKRKIVYSDFEDEFVGEVAEVRFGNVGLGSDFAAFKARTRAWLDDRWDDLVIQKLHRNKQLTTDDLTELERMLTTDGVGNSADLQHAKQVAHGLGLFIRTIIGLDRQAAKNAFAGFLEGKVYTSTQVDFINMVMDQLTVNGVLDPRRLAEPPFTELAPRGPDSLLGSADADEVIAILDSVRGTALPEQGVA